jgi:protocatechuate 3,4-dioxygenase, beta subunit
MTKWRLTRRDWLLSAAALPLASASSLAAPQMARLRPTPAQTEGPFYPVNEPIDADFDLLNHGDLRYYKGIAAWVVGRVVDINGKPLNGGVIEIWQCDEAGHYDHPADGAKNDPNFQGFGRVLLDRDGQFKFRTIKPVAYGGRTPHIHAKIKLGKTAVLTTQLYVQDDPGNQRDAIWRRLSEADRSTVTRPYVASLDGLRADYQLVVQL